MFGHPAAFSIIGKGQVIALGGGVVVFGSGMNELVLRIPAVVPLGAGLAVASGIVGEGFCGGRHPDRSSEGGFSVRVGQRVGRWAAKAVSGVF